MSMMMIAPTMKAAPPQIQTSLFSYARCSSSSVPSCVPGSGPGFAQRTALRLQWYR